MPTRHSRSRTSGTSSRTVTSFVRASPRTFWTLRNSGRRTSRLRRAGSGAQRHRNPQEAPRASPPASRGKHHEDLDRRRGCTARRSESEDVRRLRGWGCSGHGTRTEDEQRDGVRGPHRGPVRPALGWRDDPDRQPAPRGPAHPGLEGEGGEPEATPFRGPEAPRGTPGGPSLGPPRGEPRRQGPREVQVGRLGSTQCQRTTDPEGAASGPTNSSPPVSYLLIGPCRIFSRGIRVGSGGRGALNAEGAPACATAPGILASLGPKDFAINAGGELEDGRAFFSNDMVRGFRSP